MADAPQTFIIETADAGQRVDAYLAKNLPEHSRSHWQRQIKAELVLLGSEKTAASHKLSEGDILTVLPMPVHDFSKNTLPIIFEDKDVMVLNKPQGILTHAKGEENDEFTVAEFMRHYTTDGLDGNRPGIVHRLDRDTSGVIIAAKNSEAKRFLQKQFSNRKAKKSYIALVKGRPKEASATIKLPIERNPKKPQTFRVGPNGKPAETAYEVLKQFKKYTLVWLKPVTGRTHQLRVHMHYIGCPIVGDKFYGKEEKALGRLFLHAETLEITLPNKERQTFTAPLAPELLAFLKTLQS